MEPQLPPEPLPPVAPAPPPADRLHPVSSITWATALGAPVSGGIVLALNYWKWGQKPAAAAAVSAGLLVTAVIVWLALLVPSYVPGAVFVVPQVLGGYFVAKALQGRRLEAHRAAGGANASNWIGAGIGLGFTAVLVAVVVGVVVTGVNPGAMFETQQWVDMGQGQEVDYTRGATRSDAERLGEALKEYGYFDGTVPSMVLLAGKPGAREVSFLGSEGAWDDSHNVDYIRDLAEYVAPSIGGLPLTVRLLDERMYEQKRLRIE